MNGKIEKVEEKIRNPKAVYKCWNCHKMVETVNSRNHFCKECRNLEMVSTEHESKQIKLEAIEENLSAMVILEKCGTKSSWSAPILGINWVKPKERHQVLRRFLKDWDIKAGIEKGQIRIVEENEEEIKAPELSNETKTKTKIGGDLEW